MCMCGYIVQELLNSLICVFIGLGLLTSNGIEGHQHSQINSSDIPKDAINNLLYLFLSLIIHSFTAVFRDYVLRLLVILLWLWFVWTILGPWWGQVLVFLELLLGITTRHRNIQRLIIILIPIQIDTMIQFAFLVCGYCVLLLQHLT